MCDLSFFFGALIYQGLARQHSDQDSWLPDTAPSIDNLSAADPYYSSEDSTTGSSSGHIIGDISSGSGHILLALTWWINPKTLRLQDVLCSVAADLLGVAGEEVAVVGKHCVSGVLVAYRSIRLYYAATCRGCYPRC